MLSVVLPTLGDLQPTPTELQMLFVLPGAPATRLAWALGAYHALAGFIGFVTTVDYAPVVIERLAPEVRGQATMMYGVVAAVFLAVLLSGVLLLRSARQGIVLATIVQLVQVPLWAWGTTAYSFFAGLYVPIVWSPEGWRVLYGWKANLQLAWGNEAVVPFVGINVIPALILAALHRMRRSPSTRWLSAATPPTT
jgi:hypothetical protein